MEAEEATPGAGGGKELVMDVKSQAMESDQVPDNVPPTAPAPPLSEFLLNIEDYTPTVSCR